LAPERVQEVEMAERVDAVALNHSAAHALKNIIEQTADPAGRLRCLFRLVDRPGCPLQHLVGAHRSRRVDRMRSGERSGSGQSLASDLMGQDNGSA
jgi:hypothetical protein